jgi:hypothetical protein
MRKIYIGGSHSLSVDDAPSGKTPGLRYVLRRPPRDPSYWVRPGPPRKKRPR